MAPRANWKGFLKVGELVCPVALYTAASTGERIAFHMLNRKTGHRLHREFVDSETGKVVERDDQMKGYEVGDNDYIALDPEEIAAAMPQNDKTLEIGAFIACDDIDDLYLDKPYYLTPSDRHGAEAFALIREGMKTKKVAALAETVLFRRVRTLLIRPEDEGFVAATLNYNYEVRSAEKAFAEIPAIKLKGEMLELAEHIIKTKSGRFDPKTFDDRYDAALAEVVKAKIEGRKIRPVKAKAERKVIDLMEALRQSAGKDEKPAKRGAKKPAPSRRKAG
ncbi:MULTISPECIES: Ku protein [unclassified Rhizobium]|uniref:non-homologous end joining protein Ku n=1 Tax=unclassified Rhizobium TaxID=2613769 RepID=UPI0006FEA582|nr:MULTISPECIES: Ku protein [unclassified Rhizobium]KQV41453.1 Ku protein [Rhizobium sp. Root1212]KRD37088.1 Ku protein [Rhizobium sp. Root268]